MVEQQLQELGQIVRDLAKALQTEVKHTSILTKEIINLQNRVRVLEREKLNVPT